MFYTFHMVTNLFSINLHKQNRDYVVSESYEHIIYLIVILLRTFFSIGARGSWSRCFEG